MFRIKYYFVKLYELVWFKDICIFVPFVCVCVCVCVCMGPVIVTVGHTHVALTYEDI